MQRTDASADTVPTRERRVQLVRDAHTEPYRYTQGETVDTAQGWLAPSTHQKVTAFERLRRKSTRCAAPLRRLLQRLGRRQRKPMAWTCGAQTHTRWQSQSRKTPTLSFPGICLRTQTQWDILLLVLLLTFDVVRAFYVHVQPRCAKFNNKGSRGASVVSGLKDALAAVGVGAPAMLRIFWCRRNELYQNFPNVRLRSTLNAEITVASQ